MVLSRAVLTPRIPLQAAYGNARTSSGSHGIGVCLSDRVSAATALSDASKTHSREQPIVHGSLPSASSDNSSSHNNNRERSVGPVHYAANELDVMQQRLLSSSLASKQAAADVAHVVKAFDMNVGHALLNQSSITALSLKDSAIDFPKTRVRGRTNASSNIRVYALPDGHNSVTSDEAEHLITDDNQV